MPDEAAAPPTPTFERLGTPEHWTCPKCGDRWLVFPGLPMECKCKGAKYNPHVGPRTFYYYYVLSDDHRVHSLRLIDADDADPFLRVESQIDGQIVQWERRTENGELCFYPPSEAASRDHYLRYDERIQKHEELPRHLHHRAALCGRHSA